MIEAIPDGRGVHMIDGKMQDDATWKQCKVMVDLAEMLAAKDPELAEAYGFDRRIAAESMRFFEYESRARSSSRPGIPVTEVGFATTPRRRARSPSDIGGPVVIKSQVLTGGRMKAGGVKFADTPEEAGRARRSDILELEINGHMPRGVLVDAKAEVKQEYYAGVVWDGIRKQPVMLFSDMGGIDIEEVAEQHPDHVGRGHFSNLLPLSDFQAKQVIASVGVTGSALNRLTPILATPGAAVRRARHDAGGDQPARAARGRHASSRVDAHMEMENEARRARRRCSTELGVGDEETREAREPTPFEIDGEAVDAVDHRGVAGNVTEFDGNLGLVIGAGGGSLTLFDAVRAHGGKPANYCEIGGNPSVAKACGLAKLVLAEAGRGQDRGDDVDRLQHARGHRRARRDQGLPRAGLRPGREDRDLPHPGRLGGRGLQDPRAVRRRVLRPLGVDARGRAARGGEDPGAAA